MTLHELMRSEINISTSLERDPLTII